MLFLTATTDKFQLVTGQAVTVDVHASYVDLSGTTVTPGKQNTAIVTATTTDIVASPGASTTRNLKSLIIRNKHASQAVDVTVVFDQNGTDFELIKATLSAGDVLHYIEGVGFTYKAANFSNFASGSVTTVDLTVQHDIAVTTPTEITGLQVSLQAGVYVFSYHLIYQAALATTGIRLSVNYTGTTTRIVYNQYWVDTSATASTAVPDQDAIAATGHIVGSFASRVNSVAGRGVTLSTDTANADMYMIIEGVLVAGGSGDLELWHGAEVAGTSSVMIGSSLILHTI